MCSTPAPTGQELQAAIERSRGLLAPAAALEDEIVAKNDSSVSNLKEGELPYNGDLQVS